MVEIDTQILWPYNRSMNNRNSKKGNVTIDDLAILIQKGFLELKSEISDTKKELKSDIGKLDKKLAKVESRLGNIEAELNKKVDKVDHNTLKYRVEKLEKKYA